MCAAAYVRLVYVIGSRCLKPLQSQTAKDSAWLLYDTALLNSGFQMDDPKEFSGRMFSLMQQ